MRTSLLVIRDRLRQRQVLLNVRYAPDSDQIPHRREMTRMVESRTGAVAGGLRPSLRFPSSLIELDVPISGIQLSD